MVQPVTHRAFDEQMALLDALRSRPLDEECVLIVRKTLAAKSNFLVAKAARLAEENGLATLMPDLLSSFDRFFTNPEKNDPQCWAKNALSRALAHLGCSDKEVFLRGLCFQQWEPTWGGKSDSAGALRANCAHALVSCDGLDNQQLLVLLLDPLTDHDKSVRVEAVRAIAQLGMAAVPVIRLRALTAGLEPEETAQCFAALWSIEREAVIPFLARCLQSEDDHAGEAALALSETHHPQALEALLSRYATATDPWFSGVLLSAIGLTRLPGGLEFLLRMIEDEDRMAEVAIEALARVSPGEDLAQRIHAAVEATGSRKLRQAWQEHFKPRPDIA